MVNIINKFNFHIFMLTSLISTILVWGTVLVQASIIFIVALFLLKKFNFIKKDYLKSLKNYAYPSAFLVSLFAVLGSLFYSQIIGLTPCPLCWWQRIFMYVLPILIFVGFILKDKKLPYYIIPLTSIGSFIAIYHYLVQLTPRLTCEGAGIDCGMVYAFHLGYITIPVMAFTAFLFITIVMLISRK